ncbi:MAG TPA: hypothetical protein VFX59_20960 [Polyangiales bacterium]|nr:hypothetical protein [Polyangiales bacterium]
MGGKGRVALGVGLLAAASGCQLIGYGLGTNDRRMDAAEPVDEDGGLDAAEGQDSGIATELDATAIRDAALQDAPAEAGKADASCTPANACGGCSTLAAALGENCGVCGLGRYSCSGSEALVCTGGDARPQAAGGAIVIDDYEDGDSLTKSGNGYTFAFSDHTAGVLDPVDGTHIVPSNVGAAGTARSAHVSGRGFTDFGAGLILWPNTEQCAFDASLQRGIKFWVKGTGTLIISAATTQTLDPSFCGTSCNDFHNETFTLTSTFTSYSLPFTSLTQTGWGTPASFDPTKLLYFQFAFGPNVSFDLYVDEISFY